MARRLAALVRHADYRQLQDVPSAHQPFPINDAGRRQAQAEAEKLRALADAGGWAIDTVIDSSRMLRAWQTAGIFAGVLADGEPLQVESFDALAERGLGCAANLSVDQIEAVLSDDPRFGAPPPGWKADSEYCLPLQGAESLLSAGRRVADHLDQVLRAMPVLEHDTLKLFVGHGAAFRHAAYHLGLLVYADIGRLSMAHCHPLVFEYLPTGDWRHVDGEWKVRMTDDNDQD